VIFDLTASSSTVKTPEFESHRRVYDSAARSDAEEWFGQIGTWSAGLEDRWHAVLCERSSRPSTARPSSAKEAAHLSGTGAARADARHPRAADRARRGRHSARDRLPGPARW